MSLSLSPELETLIRQRVADGGYSDVNEVVADAMSLLDERSIGLSEAVHRALDEGEADIAAGKVIELKTPDDINAFFKTL